MPGRPWRYIGGVLYGLAVDGSCLPRRAVRVPGDPVVELGDHERQARVDDGFEPPEPLVGAGGVSSKVAVLVASRSARVAGRTSAGISGADFSIVKSFTTIE
jgi:hypothetical protein